MCKNGVVVQTIRQSNMIYVHRLRMTKYDVVHSQTVNSWVNRYFFICDIYVPKQPKTSTSSQIEFYRWGRLKRIDIQFIWMADDTGMAFIGSSE